MLRGAMSVERTMLRHLLAALAYRTQKALRDAPEGFADFRAGQDVRTPAELVTSTARKSMNEIRNAPQISSTNERRYCSCERTWAPTSRRQSSQMRSGPKRHRRGGRRKIDVSPGGLEIRSR